MKQALIIFFAFVFFALPAFAESGIQTIAKQAIVLDYDTGAVLLDKNADEKMPTSSMSKVMTSYVAYDFLKQGKISEDQEVPVSEKAWKMGGSRMFLDVNKTVKISDLIRGVVIQSGNDASVALAEGIAGTEDAFVAIMNAEAKKLGMENSNFMDASGWPHENHYSTARDLAKLGMALIRDFPDRYKIYSEKEFVYNNIRQGNRNPLLYKNIGGDGIKTGHTEAAGYGLIGSGISPEGRRVVFVLNGLPDMAARADEATRILEWALRSFENRALVKGGQAVDAAPVYLGQSVSVPLMIKDDIVTTVPRGISADYKVTVYYNAPLKAPVRKGDKVGTLKIDIPRSAPVERPLYAAADVQKLNFFTATIGKFMFLLTGE
jgi:D-alanyl-D-alanine carboxypeptidase (penicillin-binding protein 5/6)